MNDQKTLTGLNQLPQSDFVAQLGRIYEHSSWVAEQAYLQKPFDSLEQLRHIMFGIVQAADIDMRLALIRNHPELAGKEADLGRLTADSQKEQAGAGLNQCSAEELQKLRDLNKRYLDKFGFPFVIAVSGLNKYQIIDAMRVRLDNDYDIEISTGINEIGKIARIRLDAFIDG